MTGVPYKQSFGGIEWNVYFEGDGFRATSIDPEGLYVSAPTWEDLLQACEDRIEEWRTQQTKPGD